MLPSGRQEAQPANTVTVGAGTGDPDTILGNIMAKPVSTSFALKLKLGVPVIIKLFAVLPFLTPSLKVCAFATVLTKRPANNNEQIIFFIISCCIV